MFIQSSQTQTLTWGGHFWNHVKSLIWVLGTVNTAPPKLLDNTLPAHPIIIRTLPTLWNIPDQSHPSFSISRAWFKEARLHPQFLLTIIWKVCSLWRLGIPVTGHYDLHRGGETNYQRLGTNYTKPTAIHTVITTQYQCQNHVLRCNIHYITLYNQLFVRKIILQG